jgi:hypothetical protein
MKESADGLVQIGDGARELGVRAGVDVPARSADDFVRPGQGGLSVSPDDPMNLPSFRRPPEFQGVGKGEVWTLTTLDLGLDLSYRPDPASPRHGFIEPVRPMQLSEYRQALALTRAHWRKERLESEARSEPDET